MALRDFTTKSRGTLARGTLRSRDDSRGGERWRDAVLLDRSSGEQGVDQGYDGVGSRARAVGG